MNNIKNNNEEFEQLKKQLAKPMTFNRLARVGLFSNEDALPIPENAMSVSNELYLFRSVLDRLLLDMFSPNKEIKNEAFRWVQLDNPEFKNFCTELCYLEPEPVYETFKAMVEIINESRKRKK